MIYVVTIWVLGLLLGTTWTVLFAQTFNGMTQSTAEIINDLSTPSTESSHHMGVAFIVVSILAESFLSAACVLTIETIVRQHTPSKRVRNPAYEQTQADLDRWLKRQAEHDELCARINGKLEALERAKHRYAEEVVGAFHVALLASAA